MAEPTPFTMSQFISKDDLIAAQAKRIEDLEAAAAGSVQSSSAPLLPCPFCGASASGHEIEPHQHSAALLALVPEMPKEHHGSYVIEGDCQCGSGLIGDNQAEVTARWNARAPTPPQAVAAQAAPVAHFDDPRVQTVYNIICKGETPPKGEHWEGFVARQIVDALATQADVQAEPVAQVLGWVRKKDGEFSSHFFTYEPHCDCSVRDNGGEKIAVVAATAPQATKPYSMDQDPQGIRALVAVTIEGAIARGLQGGERPPQGHWLTSFYEIGAQAQPADALDAAPAAPINSEALQVIKALREWVMAVPADVAAALPAMPGIDADWMDTVEAALATHSVPADGLMVNMTPPATSRDRWMYNQGRLAEVERICAAIKTEDDYCVDEGDYMLDSDDCIKIARGLWLRPTFDRVAMAAAQEGGNAAKGKDGAA